MSAGDSEDQRPTSDEDWKARAKAEAAELDAQSAEPAAPAESSESADQEQQRKARAAQSQKIDPSQLPKADFPLLVSIFSTQAMAALGFLPNPITGEADPQPALAKHYIDLLAMIEKKTQGNLEPAEKNMLTNTLHELRMVYLDQSKATS